MTRLSDYKVLTFDCYGTLIDWESGLWDALQPLLMTNQCFTLHRDQALTTYAALESSQEARSPGMRYSDVLRTVHRQFADENGLESSLQLDDDFARSLAHWPAFPDTADALRFLKSHYKLVILSNVDRAGFAASNRKLGVEFDAIYTAEDIGSYKPSMANFEYLSEHLKRDFGLDSADVLHVAQSLFHDHVPARKFGLSNAWIDRQRLSESGSWGATAEVSERPQTDHRFFSMRAMADAVKDEQGA